MKGERFGKMDFRIEHNKTGSPEKFMLRTHNGWYPIIKIQQKKGKLKLKFDWVFRPSPALIDLEVLKRAIQFLSVQNSWNNNDDRICEDDFGNKQ